MAEMMDNSYSVEDDRQALLDRIHQLEQENQFLRKLEKWMRMLAVHAPVAISVTDEFGHFEFANERWKILSGMSPEQAEDGSWVEGIHPDDRERVVSALEASNKNEKEVSIEYRMVRLDGTVIWVCADSVVVRDENNRAYYLGTMTDITELKKAEDALRAADRLEATATLAGGIAHEFNNLMVAVLGNAEMLAMDRQNSPAEKKMLDEITSAAQRSANLARQLLAFARKGKFETQIFNLNKTIQGALSFQGRLLREKGIALDLDLDAELWNIKADPTQMVHVINSIVINSAEAIQNGGKITVHTQNEIWDAKNLDSAGLDLKPGAYIHLSVQDTGSGMAPDVLARAFEPFFSTKFQGRGLGLASVYGIIKNHEGQILLQSTPGRGTTCEVYLPATPMEKAVQTKKETSVPASKDEKKTILLIDDEDAVISVTRRILERYGYRVFVARNGQEAVDLVNSSQESIHVALLDIGMPVMNGVEAFPLLTAARPKMKIIICTGFEPNNDDAQPFHKSGAFAFLQKPFRADMLTQEIKKAIEAYDSAS